VIRRCTRCGEEFTSTAAAERHWHPSPYGGRISRIEYVLKVLER
jgi:hypothetical protein